MLRFGLLCICYNYATLRRYKVEAEEGFDNVVVVDGVPVVDRSKLDKLVAKISKEFGKKGAHIKTDNIFVPWDDAKDKSKGCVRYARAYYQRTD